MFHGEIAITTHNNNPIKVILQEDLNAKSNDDGFPHYRSVFCLKSTIAHLTAGIQDHHYYIYI